MAEMRKHCREIKMTEILKTSHGADMVALAEVLSGLCLSIDRHMTRLARKSGVSVTAAQLLVHLDDGGPSRCTDLVRLSGYNARTVAAALKSLEQGGLVWRSRDERDARAKRITVTDRGRDVARAVASRRRRFLVELLDVLNLHERERLMTMLAKLRHRLACYEPPRFDLALAWSESCQSDAIPADHVGRVTTDAATMAVSAAIDG
jgi:DNA-binding MarR family transcriptional regulator